MSAADDKTRRWFEGSEGFRLLVESVSDYAIFMLAPSGTIATWNVGAERIKGYTASEVIGRHFSIFYPEEEARSGKCEYELEVAAAVGKFEEEGWRLRKDGTRFWASVAISAMRDGDGDLVGFAKVTRDLTERRRADEAERARMVAEEANRAKDEFLAMLGHELRNPMAPILTALQLMKLRNQQTSREQQIIERQVRYMTTLVDDLLDVSRITRGKVVLKRDAVDLRRTIANAVEVASPLLEQRTHHLDVGVPAEPILIDGDEARLTQIFSNLLTNAAKYTNAGGHIAVRVALEAGGVAVSVEDDGVGIEPELLPRIFDLFVQGRQSAERPSGGLGLGLALVRALVELHHGSVEARSGGAGNGSTFTVHLPVLQAAAVEAVARGALPTGPSVERPRRILLVDDNDDAREMLIEALSSVGHEVRGAADPVQALEVVQSFVPEVAVLDIGLPVMDGYELAARLTHKLAASAPRLIALTGYGQPQDQARSAEAGFHLHLVKPVDVRRLLDDISAFD